MVRRLMIAVLILGSMGLAQQQQQQQSIGIAIRDGAAPDASTKKPSKEQLERGMDMLKTAEGQAAGLQGGMRAYTYLQLARAYATSDKAKALELLEDALTATRSMDDDGMQTRARLQQQILNEMVPLAPQRADELMAQVDVDSRERVLSALLAYYEKSKQLDHAIELIYRIGQEKEIPYGAVSRLLQVLPPEQSGDAQQLFANSLASYGNHKHSSNTMTVGDSDFAGMIVRYWNRFPKEMVHDAIKEVLKQAAAPADDSGQAQPQSISMASADGAVAFNSMYEYRLFQLLPVLRQIDESEANELLKKFQDVKTLLAKYPQGTDSISPPQPQGGAGQGGPPRGAMTAFGSGRGPGGGGMPMPLEMQRMQKIIADSDAHPADALAQAATISDPNMQANVLSGIARVAWRKNSSVAKSALEKLLEVASKMEPQVQIMSLRNAASIYLQMDETDDAKKVVERGLAAADKVYKADTNGDDPNKALKAYWPSTEAYRSFLRVAGQISPAWALTLLKDISDAEIKVAAQTSLASAWLDVPTGPTTIVSSHKGGTNMMMTDDRRN